jgi:DNA primase
MLRFLAPTGAKGISIFNFLPLPRRDHWTNAVQFIKTLAKLVRAVPGIDTTVKFQEKRDEARCELSHDEGRSLYRDVS